MASDRLSPERSGGGDLAPAVATAIATAALFAVPFLVVALPPITDLPQQTAQIRLLFEALGGDAGYHVQALHPNKLGYLPLLVGWWLGGPLAAGRLGLLLIALLWVAALHVLARRAGRPPSSAVIASLFFFNHTTYWGFLNFAVGLPVFALWLVVVDRRAQGRGRGIELLGAALLLSSAHVLWLAAGLLWLGAVTVVGRAPWREVLRRGAWVGPVVVAVAAWYLFYRGSGVDERVFWGRPPWLRLHPTWLLGTALGGLRGAAEPVVAVAVLAWLALGFGQGRRGQAVDRRFLVLGLLFLAAALFLPEVSQHAIFFAARWVPMAAVFLVLAAPSPRLPTVLRGTVAALLAATLVAATAAAWIGFETEELRGFDESLAALTPGERVLGLDFVRESPRIAGYPYHHFVGYAQALRGVELNRSFADEASSLVVFRELPKDYPWSDRLDWYPQRFRTSDRDQFDAILVHADPATQAFFLADPVLAPLTPDLPWRLYRVRRGAAEKPGGERP